MLDMSSPKSAADNVVYPMRRLGLLGENGSLTERGHKWRIDSTYAEACQEILDDVYSPDLTAFVDGDGAPDVSQIENWMQHQGFGGTNAKQMAATYVMIAEKKLPDAVGKTQPRNGGEPKTRTRATRTATQKLPNATLRAKDIEQPIVESSSGAAGPVVHLDIQIHIPADASTDQIDQIFASMAKHLYQK